MTTKSSIAVQRWLGFELKRRRHAAGLTQQQAAYQAGISKSYLEMLEGTSRTTRRSPHPVKVRSLLQVYGCEHEMALFEAQMRTARSQNWWERLDANDQLPDGYEVYIALEEGSSDIEWYEPLILPGLLQTSDYARWVIAPDPTSGVTPEALANEIEIRQRRQAALTRSEQPVTLWAVTTVEALRKRLATADVMREQMDHLLEMTTLRNVNLQVLSAPTPLGSRGPFTILHFASEADPGTVYVETPVRSLWFEAPAEIDAFGDVMNQLRARALHPAKSAQLIEDIRKEMT